MGNAGINFLNIIPKLGSTVASFFGNLFTDVFNSIYNQQIDQKSARNVIVGFFVVVGITTAIIAGFNTYKSYDTSSKKVEEKKSEVKIKKEVKKTETNIKKEKKEPEAKNKSKLKVKKDEKNPN